MSKQEFLNQQAAIAQAANQMRATLIDSQFSGPNNAFISDAVARNAAIEQAAALDPLYASMGEHGAEVAKIHAQSIADHVNAGGAEPDDMLLASVRQQLANLYENVSSESSASLLLASVSKNVNSSAGVPTIVTTAQLTLPVALATITNDFVTYIPSKRSEKVEVWELETVAGTTIGDIKKNDILTSLTMGGQFSDMDHFYDFKEQPDGEKTTLNFKPEADTPAARKLPIKAGSAQIFINKVLSAEDQGDGKLYGSVTVGGKELTVTGTVDYETGNITVTTTSALPKGVEVMVEFFLNIEEDPSLIPEITSRATSFTIRPSERVLRSTASIQADFKMGTELNVNARSQRLTALRDYISAETAISQIKKMARLCIKETPFSAKVPAGSNDSWKDRFEYIRTVLEGISNDLLSDSEEGGLRGVYCGRALSSFFKMLPADCFKKTPGYQQVNRPHFVGIAFDQYRIYEVPQSKVIGDNEGIGYAKAERLSRAPFYVGAVIPTTLYDHDVDQNLKKSDTIWTKDFSAFNPKHGQKFVHKLILTDFQTGE